MENIINNILDNNTTGDSGLLITIAFLIEDGATNDELLKMNISQEDIDKARSYIS